MQRVLEMMRDAMVETWTVVGPWASDLVVRVPAWAWASLATLVLLAAALRMLRPTRVEAGAPPEVLLTRAQATADGPASDRFRVEAAFSNLHYETVQLLRIAVVGASGPPAVAEVPAIVAARRAVELRTEVVLRPGGRGRLDLYLFVPSSPAKAWRLRVPLNWDPFTRRYTAVLLGQRAKPVRRLPEPEPPLPRRRRPVPVGDAPGAHGVRAGSAAVARTEASEAVPAAPPAAPPDAAPPERPAAPPAEPPREPPRERPAAPPEEPPDAPAEEPTPGPPRAPRLRFPDRF
jgi:hypothetical protein